MIDINKQESKKENIAQTSISDNSIKPKRRIEFDYLRTFVTIGVVFHHAILAYHSQSELLFLYGFSPVADSAQWIGWDFFVSFNDYWHMPLMFLISGLFVWKSLERKGAGKYILGRLKRLGIVFIIGVLLLIPIALYARMMEGQIFLGWPYTSLPQFWLEMAKIGFGTAGPLWFLWLLLVFDGIIAIVYLIYRASKNKKKSNETEINTETEEVSNPEIIEENRIETIEKNSSNTTKKYFENPLMMFGLVIAIFCVGYFQGAFSVDTSLWIGIGPFGMQISRLGFYLTAFMLGVFLGKQGLDNTVFKKNSQLAKYWWAFLLVGLIAFGITIPVDLFAIKIEILHYYLKLVLFPIVSACLVYGVIGVFIRFFTKENAIFNSLKNNAYGIYIFHYIFVLWLQFAFLYVPILHGILKGIIVTICSILLCWGFTAIFRLIPGAKQII